MIATGELASALASRVFESAGVGATTQALFHTALDRVEALFLRAKIRAPMDALATLLQPPAQPSARGAAEVAERLAACLPVDRALVSAVLDPVGKGRLEYQALQQRWTPPALQPALQSRNPQALFNALGKQLDPDAGRLWGEFLGLTAKLTLFTSIAAPKWTSGDVPKVLKEQLEKWSGELKGIGAPTSRTKKVKDDILTELAFGLPVRLGVAGMLSAGALTLYGKNDLGDDVSESLGLPSSSSIGQSVHQQLQEQYRVARSKHLIEQDDRVWQSSVARSLEDAAINGGRTDLQALYLARQSLKVVSGPFLPADAPIPNAGKILNRRIRDDNTNLTEARIFEIKPVRGAWQGVLQEMYYRSSFNMWSAVLRDFDVVGSAIGELLGGKWGGTSGTETLVAGQWGDWPEANTGRTGVMPITGRSQAVMVTQVDALPGLVLYWVFDMPVAALKVLYDTFRDQLQKGSAQLKRLTIEALTWVIAIAIALVAVLLLLLVAAETFELAEIYAVIRVASSLGPAVAAALKAFVDALRAIAPQWILSSTADAASGRIVVRLDPSTTPKVPLIATGVQIGYLRVDNIPIDAAKHLGAVIQAGLYLLDYAWAPATPPGTV